MKQRVHSALIVDDDMEIGNLLLDYFESRDIEAHHEITLEGGLEFMKNFPTDLVILDDNFQSGVKGAFYIPGFKNLNTHCLLYMLSGNGNAELRQKAALLGANGFLAKPVNLSTLDILIKPGFLKPHVWE